MGPDPPHRETCNRGRMAPHRLQTILDLEKPAASARTPRRRSRDPRADPAHQQGQSTLCEVGEYVEFASPVGAPRRKSAAFEGVSSSSLHICFLGSQIRAVRPRDCGLSSDLRRPPDSCLQPLPIARAYTDGTASTRRFDRSGSSWSIRFAPFVTGGAEALPSEKLCEAEPSKFAAVQVAWPEVHIFAGFT